MATVHLCSCCSHLDITINWPLEWGRHKCVWCIVCEHMMMCEDKTVFVSLLKNLNFLKCYRSSITIRIAQKYASRSKIVCLRQYYGDMVKCMTKSNTALYIAALYCNLPGKLIVHTHMELYSTYKLIANVVYNILTVSLFQLHWWQVRYGQHDTELSKIFKFTKSYGREITTDWLKFTWILNPSLRCDHT